MNRSSDCFWSARSSRGVPRAALASAALLLALLVTPPMAVADPSPPAGRASYNVLLLFAAWLTPAGIAIDEAFRSTLSSRLSAPAFYTGIDLAVPRRRPAARLRALLKHKYHGVKPTWSRRSPVARCGSRSRIAPISFRARRSCSAASIAPPSAISSSTAMSPASG
jgi:hypothetical protein